MGPHFCFHEGWRNLLMGLNSVERRDLMTQERAGIFGAMSLNGGNAMGSNYCPIWKP